MKYVILIFLLLPVANADLKKEWECETKKRMYFQMQEIYVDQLAISPYSTCTNSDNPVQQQNCLQDFDRRKRDIERQLQGLEEWIGTNCFQ